MFECLLVQLFCSTRTGKPSRREGVQLCVCRCTIESIAAKQKMLKVVFQICTLYLVCNPLSPSGQRFDLSMEDVNRKSFWCLWLMMIAANVNWLFRIKMVLREFGFVLLLLLQFDIQWIFLLYHLFFLSFLITEL